MELHLAQRQRKNWRPMRGKAENIEKNAKERNKRSTHVFSELFVQSLKHNVRKLPCLFCPSLRTRKAQCNQQQRGKYEEDASGTRGRPLLAPVPSFATVTVWQRQNDHASASFERFRCSSHLGCSIKDVSNPQENAGPNSTSSMRFFARQDIALEDMSVC